MFRVLMLALAGYAAYKLFKGGKAQKEEAPVRGQNAHQPLDLSQQDVDDADFEDIPEDK